MRLADRYFSMEEVHDLRSVPESLQRERFLEYWTLKEAYIKAKGKGLSIPLEQFAFRITDNLPLAVWFDPSLDDRPDGWCFLLARIAGRYGMALAVQRDPGEPVRVFFRETVPLGSDRPAEVEVLRTSTQV